MVAVEVMRLLGFGYNLQVDVTDFLIDIDVTAKNIEDIFKNIV